MARIPTAADLPQVQPVRTPTIKIPKGAISNMGEGLMELGAALGDIGKRRLEAERAMQLEKAKAAHARRVTDWLIGGGNE
ncbi:MAG: hypothetical protein CMM61_15685 [Rhodospirillaceae bacterium]|nr:hypothetical protein [Rhodospirillaceae bacterium]